MNLIRAIFLFVVILLSTTAYSQPPLPNPTGRLTIIQGGNVIFNFNSLKRYMDGITLTRWTKIDAQYDSDGGGTSWRLAVKATQAQLDGDGGNTLNLNKIEITALDGGGTNNLTAFCQPKIVLTNLDQDLITGNPPDGTNLGENVVDLTYECGITNSVLGENPDYYVVDLEITLYED